jgi:hypothetical protein
MSGNIDSLTATEIISCTGDFSSNNLAVIIVVCAEGGVKTAEKPPCSPVCTKVS